MTLEEQNNLSKQILDEMFETNYDFIRKDLPNKDYLESNILSLEKMALLYKQQSENVTLPSHIRAKSRDLLQNCYGLINGIKFSISFLDHREVNLFEYSPEIESKE